MIDQPRQPNQPDSSCLVPVFCIVILFLPSTDNLIPRVAVRATTDHFRWTVMQGSDINHLSVYRKRGDEEQKPVDHIFTIQGHSNNHADYTMFICTSHVCKAYLNGDMVSLVLSNASAPCDQAISNTVCFNHNFTLIPDVQISDFIVQLLSRDLPLSF